MKEWNKPLMTELNISDTKDIVGPCSNPVGKFDAAGNKQSCPYPWEWCTTFALIWGKKYCTYKKDDPETPVDPNPYD